MPDLPDQPSANNDHDNRLQAIHQRSDTYRQSGDLVPASQLSPQPVKEVELLSWSSDSRVFDPKNTQWFLGLFALAFIFVIIFAIMQEFMLILVTVGLVFVLYALARVAPMKVQHTIYNTGVKSASRMYLWKELNSFWIYDHKGVTLLRLDTKHHFMRTIEIILEDISQDEVGNTMVQYLPSLEKPAPEAEAMADHAFMSVASKVPFSGKIMSWMEKQTNYASGNTPKN